MRALIAGALIASAILPAAAYAAYPSRPIDLVVPYAPGGTADALARIVAQYLGEKLHTSIIVENKPGASGMIGEEYVVRSKPDGYTLLYGATPLAINPALHKMNFNPATDLVPLTLVCVTPMILAVSKKSKLNSIADIVKAAKANPGKLTFTSGGTGTLQFMAGALFEQREGIKLLHVSYASGGPAIMGTAEGVVDMDFTDLTSGLPLVRSGQLKALAITSPKRNPLLPNTPTVAESGLPGYQVYEWNGMFVPKGTPKNIAPRLEVSLQEVLKEPKVKAKFAFLGADIVASTPQALKKYLAGELSKWADVAHKAKIAVQ